MTTDPLARFSDESGEYSYNDVEDALNSIGVSLVDVNGQFRAFDDVIFDIAKKWGSLTNAQQKYIATQASGSRQQSRFIALVSNLDRLQEITNYANNAEGAAEKQFDKTLDSLETKTQRLQNSFEEFTRSFLNQDMLKGLTDVANGGLTLINKIGEGFGALGDGSGSSLLKIATGVGAVTLGIKGLFTVLGSGLKTGLSSYLTFLKTPFKLDGAKDMMGNITNTFSSTNLGQKGALINAVKNMGGKVSIDDLIQIKDNGNSKFKGDFSKLIKGLGGKTFQKEFGRVAQSYGSTLNNTINEVLQSSVKGGASKGNIQAMQKAIAQPLDNLQKAIKSGNFGAVQGLRSELESALSQGFQSLKVPKGIADTMAQQINNELDTAANKINIQKIQQKLQGQMMGIGMAVGAAGLAISGISEQIGKSIKDIDKFESSATKVSAAMGQVGQAASTMSTGIMAIGMLGVGSPFGWITMGITAVTAIISAINNYKKSMEEARQATVEAGKEIVSSYKEQKSEITNNLATITDSMKDLEKYQKLVDDQGRNLGLTTDEYDNYLSIANEIAEINPELVVGYDSLGNAILETNAAQKAYNSALKESKDLQAEFLSTDTLDDIIKGFDAEMAGEDAQNILRSINKTWSDIWNTTGTAAAELEYQNASFMEKAAYNAGRNVNAGIGRAPGVNVSQNALKTAQDPSLSKGLATVRDSMKKAGIEVASLGEMSIAEMKTVLDTEKTVMADLETTENDAAIKTAEDFYSDLQERADYIKEAYSGIVEWSTQYVNEMASNMGMTGEALAYATAGIQEVIEASDGSSAGIQKGLDSYLKKCQQVAKGQNGVNKSFDETVDAINDYADVFKKTMKDDPNALNVYREKVADLRQEWLDYADSVEDAALQEYIYDFIDSLEMAEVSVLSVADAFNPLQSAVADTAAMVEQLSDITAGDYYQANENLKTIVDEVMKEENASGKGSKTFRAGTEMLFGTDYLESVNYDVDTIYNRLESTRSMFAGGLEPAHQFADYLVQSKDAIEQAVPGFKVLTDEAGNFVGYEADFIGQSAEIAAALGLSEEAMKSLFLNMSQYLQGALTDVTALKNALVLNEVGQFTDNGTVLVSEQELKAQYLASGGDKDGWEELKVQFPENQIVAIDTTSAKDMAKYYGEEALKNDKETFGSQTKEDKLATETVMKSMIDMGASMDDAVAAMKILADENKLDQTFTTDQQWEDLYNSQLTGEENPLLSPLENIYNAVQEIANYVANERGDLSKPQKELQEQAKEDYWSLVGKKGSANQLASGGELTERGQMVIDKFRNDTTKTSRELDKWNSDTEKYRQVQKQLQQVIADTTQAQKNLSPTQADYEEKLKEYTKTISDAEARLANIDKVVDERDKAAKQYQKDIDNQSPMENLMATEYSMYVKVDSEGAFDQLESLKAMGFELEGDPVEITTLADDAAAFALELLGVNVDNIKQDGENIVIHFDGNYDDVKAQLEELNIDTTNLDEKTMDLTVNTGDVETATNKVQTLINTIKDKSMTVSVNDAATAKLQQIKEIRDGITDKTVTITSINKEITQAKRQGDLYTGNASFTDLNTNTLEIPSYAKGKLGPNNHGGLTLTGELGPEIAWFPSKGTAAILGQGGPELANLPADTIVYNAKDSKKIAERGGTYGLGSLWTGIGSQATTQRGWADTQRGDATGITKDRASSSAASASASKSAASAASSAAQAAKSAQEAEKAAEDKSQAAEPGKIYAYVYNMEQKISKEKTIQNKLAEQFSRTENSLNITYNDQVKNLQAQIKSYKQQLSYQKKLQKYYNNQLKKFASSQGRYGNVEFDTGAKDANGDTIKTRVNLGDYIKKDKKGAYVVDTAKMNAAFGGDKTLNEAVFSAIKGYIDEMQGGLYNTNDEIESIRSNIQGLKDDIENLKWDNPYDAVWRLNDALEDTATKFNIITKRMDLLKKGISMRGVAGMKGKQISTLFDNAIQNQFKQIKQNLQLYKELNTRIKNNQKTTTSKAIKQTQTTKLGEAKKTLTTAKKQVSKEKKDVTSDKKIQKVLTKKQKKQLKNNQAIKLTKKQKSKLTAKQERQINQYNDKVQNRKKATKAVKKADKKAENKSGATKASKALLKNSKITKKLSKKDLKRLKNGETIQNLQKKYGKKLSKSQLKQLQDYNKKAKKANATTKTTSTKLSKYFKYDKDSNTYTTKVDKNGKSLLQKDLDKGKITKAQGEKLEALVEQANADAQARLEAITAIEDSMSEIVALYEEALSADVTMAQDLRSAIDKARTAQISRLEGVKNAIDNANSKIVAKMQKQIDAQRQARENEKTETELREMSERLAYLKQDTSGKNVVEIAQLEKELQEAQQSYQDTLVDQQMQTYQETMDEASSQRQEQIDLLTIIKDSVQTQLNDSSIISTTIANLEQGIALDNATVSAIKKIFGTEGVTVNSNATSSVREILKYLQDSALLSKYEQLQTNYDANQEIQGAKQSTYEDEEKILGGDTPKTLAEIAILEDKLIDSAALIVQAIQDNDLNNITTTDLTNAMKNSQGVQALIDAGLTKDDITNSNKISASSMARAGATVKQLSGLGFGAQTIYNTGKYKGREIADNTNASIKSMASWGITANEIAASSKYTWKDVLDSNAYSDKDLSAYSSNATLRKAVISKYDGSALVDKLYKLGMIKTVKDANKALKNEKNITDVKTRIKAIVDSSAYTWKDVVNSEIWDRWRLLKTYSSSAFQTAYNAKYGDGQYAKDLKKTNYKNAKAYKTGGLADYTGPAWLDGTKAKPEMVLNAKQTRGFINLVDVLDGISSKQTSTTTTDNSQTTYQIDIHVDEIGNDYDVDKLQKRIEDNILKKTKNRNVNKVNIRH